MRAAYVSAAPHGSPLEALHAGQGGGVCGRLGLGPQFAGLTDRQQEDADGQQGHDENEEGRQDLALLASFPPLRRAPLGRRRGHRRLSAPSPIPYGIRVPTLLTPLEMMLDMFECDHLGNDVLVKVATIAKVANGRSQAESRASLTAAVDHAALALAMQTTTTTSTVAGQAATTTAPVLVDPSQYVSVHSRLVPVDG